MNIEKLIKTKKHTMKVNGRGLGGDDARGSAGPKNQRMHHTTGPQGTKQSSISCGAKVQSDWIEKKANYASDQIETHNFINL